LLSGHTLCFAGPVLCADDTMVDGLITSEELPDDHHPRLHGLFNLPAACGKEPCSQEYKGTHQQQNAKA